MEIWSASKLNDTIEKLVAKGRTGDEQCVMYVLSPYMSSLGYEVFNMDEVDTDMMMGQMKITVNEHIRLVVSLTSQLPQGEKDKMFLHVDVHGVRLALYMKALGEWEKVGEIGLKDEDTEGTYPQIMRTVAKEPIQSLYEEKGERLFTEGVLRKQLNNGDVDNRFVRSVLEAELKNPSDSFIKLIAEGLTKKYSTENVSAIMGGLMGIKDIGLKTIFTEILQVDRDSIKLDDIAKPVAQEPNKLEEPKIGVNEVKKEETKGVFIERGKEGKASYEELEEIVKGTFIEEGKDVQEVKGIEGVYEAMESQKDAPRIRDFNPRQSRADRKEVVELPIDVGEPEVEEEEGSGLGDGMDLMSIINNNK